MARIKVEDLPVLEDLNPTELKGIFGGTEGSAIRAARSTGLRTSIAGTQTRTTTATDFGTMLDEALNEVTKEQEEEQATTEATTLEILTTGFPQNGMTRGQRPAGRGVARHRVTRHDRADSGAEGSPGLGLQ